jgi:membrane-associated phospholipid phosphatase/predicted protein tyrosine phosphatase
VFFFVVYGGSNHLTALRHDVGTWVYPWEHYIPFVPIFIIPYLSIDLFFIAGPFLCRDRKELSILSRRIVLAIVIAGAIFLIMPLKFTFERLQVDGFLGVIFNRFREMDLPYNQFPSLHIALRTILADLYARHTRGITRIASDIWFSLIGASTLLVYQHHVADVVGGFVLAAVCFYIVSDSPWRIAVIPNRKVGAMYAGGAIVLAIAGYLLRPAGWLLGWPALSFAAVAAGYFGVGPGIYRKSAGRLPFTTRLLFAPIIVGQRLSLLGYARRSKPWDALTDRVLLGRSLYAREARHALDTGVSAVLDLTAELPEARPFAELAVYHNLRVMDLTAPTPAQLDEAVAFIRTRVDAGQTVYVHCKAGYSRTAAVAGAYLLATGVARDADNAIAYLESARPGIIIRPEAAEAIRRYASRHPAAVSKAAAF